MQLSTAARILSSCYPSLKGGKITCIVATEDCMKIVHVLKEHAKSTNINREESEEIFGKDLFNVVTVEGKDVITLIRVGLDFVGMSELFAEWVPNKDLRKEVKLREVKLVISKLEEAIEDHAVVQNDKVIFEGLGQEDFEDLEDLLICLGVNYSPKEVNNSWSGDDPVYDVQANLAELKEYKELQPVLDSRIGIWGKKIKDQSLHLKIEEQKFDDGCTKYIEMLNKLSFSKVPRADMIIAPVDDGFDHKFFIEMSRKLGVSTAFSTNSEDASIRLSGAADIGLLAELGLDFDFTENGTKQSISSKYKYLDEISSRANRWL